MKIIIIGLLILATFTIIFLTASKCTISNVNVITVNGITGDWKNIKPISIGSASVKRLSATYNLNIFYLLIQGENLKTNGQVFINTDNDGFTGYNPRGWDSYGADYMIENDYLFKYIGKNDEWKWLSKGKVNIAKNNTTIEISIPFSLIGIKANVKVIVGYIINSSLTNRIPLNSKAASTITLQYDPSITVPVPSKGNWEGIRNYLCSYTSDNYIDIQRYKEYDALILEPRLISIEKLSSLRKSNSKSFLIGYISLGETSELLKDKEGNLLDIYFLDSNQNPIKQPNSNSYFVDCRKPLWSSLLLKEYLPELFSKGYDGVFLDTVDTSAYDDLSKGINFSVSAYEMANIIKKMKQSFPNKKVVINRGFHLLKGDKNDVSSFINGVMFEDYSSTWASPKKNTLNENLVEYRTFSQTSYQYKLSVEITKQLNMKRWKYNPDGSIIKKAGKPVKSATYFNVFTLDYALTSQISNMQYCVNRAYENAFIPSLAMKDLHEPLPYNWMHLVSIPNDLKWGKKLDYNLKSSSK